MINLFFVIHDYSGARTYANELLGWLSVQSEITVHKVYWESIYYKEFTVTKEENLLAVHIPRIPKSNNNFSKYIARSVDLINPLITHKENIIVHINRNSQIHFASEIKNRVHCKIIYTLHYLPLSFFSDASCKNQNEKVSILANEFNNHIIAKTDHIICVTHFAKTMMRLHYGFPNNKMTVIYNGYSNPKGNPDENSNKESIKNQFGFRNDDRIILFVGRLEKGKGVEKLIGTFKLLIGKYNNLRLILVGQGEMEPFMDQCHDIFGKVCFTGQLSTKHVKQLYQVADMGVIPSEFEQCSYVAIEMMQHGLPIVCSDAPGLKELFINGETASFASLRSPTEGLLGLEITAPELYIAIRQLLEDRTLAQKMARNAYQNWQNRYTVAHMGRATMKAYKQLQAAP